jgi:hypothetical protein
MFEAIAVVPAGHIVDKSSTKRQFNFMIQTSQPANVQHMKHYPIGVVYAVKMTVMIEIGFL